MTRKYVPYWDAPVQQFVEPDQGDLARAIAESYRRPIIERFYAFSDNVSPFANGRNITARLRNPSGSGIRVIWDSFTLWCNATRMYRFDLISNATDLATGVGGNSFRSNGRPALGRASFNNNNILLEFVTDLHVEANTPITVPLGLEIRETMAYHFTIGNVSEALSTDVWNLEWRWSELP